MCACVHPFVRARTLSMANGRAYAEPDANTDDAADAAANCATDGCADAAAVRAADGG